MVFGIKQQHILSIIRVVTSRSAFLSNGAVKRNCKPIDMSQKWDKDEQEFELSAETELRFEVAETSQVCLQLKCGSAEFFGTEIHRDRKYTFKPTSKGSVYTWYGCTLLITGVTSHASVVKDTPMMIYTNVHAAIEQMRQDNEASGKKGPTVLVAGPKDVGKSTLCRILINYAVRQGRKPVYVDIDVGQGQISIPGTLGALQFESQIDVEDIFSKQEPLVYHFGQKSPGHNIVLYNALTSRIAKVMSERIETNRTAFAGGIIINTCGWVKSHGYRSLTHAASAFEVDVILILGQHTLYKQLIKDMPRFVKVVFVPKCASVFERSQEERACTRDNCVKDYFYGYKNHLQPHKFEIPFSDVKIYKIDVAKSNNSYLPPGTKYYENDLVLIPVDIGFHLLYHILSVSFTASADEDVIETNVAGFVCITNIDMQQQCLTILSPHPPPLPTGILLLSDIVVMPEPS